MKIKNFLRIALIAWPVFLVSSGHIVHAEYFIEKHEIQPGQSFSFPEHNRSEKGSGVHAYQFDATFDVGKYSQGFNFTKCEKRVDSPWFDTYDQARIYLEQNPSTACQEWKLYHQVIWTEKQNCTNKEVPMLDADGKEMLDGSGAVMKDTICEPQPDKEIRQYQAAYRWLGKSPAPNFWQDGQLTLINSSLTSVPYSLYSWCGYQNPTAGQSLTRTRTYTYIYKWDEDNPKCVPAFTSNIGDTLSTDQFLTDQQVKDAINTAAQNGNSSIIYADNKEGWNGLWTNRDLQFRRRCEDDHSGCQGDSAKIGVIEAELLHNRQSKIDMKSAPTSYKDNVNNTNADNPVCEVSLQEIKSVKRTCQKGTTAGTGISYTNCSYKVNMKYDNTKWKYPLIDKIKPTVAVRIWNDTIDNKAANSVNPANGNWSFYAGEIDLALDFKDSTTNHTENGVSGLRFINFDIIDLNNNTPVRWLNISSVEWYDYDRTNGWYAYDDAGDSWQNNPHSKFNLLVPWRYKVVASAIDYAGNRSNTFEKEFSVVENYALDANGKNYSVTTRSFIDECIAKKSYIKIDKTDCEPNDSTGGYIVIDENNFTKELYADATSSRDLHLTFYDKYFNPLNTRFIKNISQYEDKPKIFLDQIANKGDAINNFFSKLPTWLEQNYNGDTEKKWITTGVWKAWLHTISWAPGKFNPNYKWELCFWDNFGINNCAEPTNIQKYTILTEKNEDQFFHILTGALSVGTSEDERINLGVDNTIGIKYFGTKNEDKVLDNAASKKFTVHNFFETLQPNYKNKQRIKITSTGEYVKDVFRYFDSDRILNNSGSVTIEQTEFIKDFIDSTAALGVISNPYLNITLTGINGETKEAKYYIANVKDDYSKSSLGYEQWNLNQIFIEWHKQTVGKEQYITNQINLLNTKYSPAEITNLVYKNAAYLTRNRNGDPSIIDNVLYIKNQNPSPKDQTKNQIKFSEIIRKNEKDKWNTLILEDYELIIDQNIENNKKNIAIAVLKNRKSNSKQSTNILINPKVTYIKSNIFVDGSIVSVNDSNKYFTKSDTKRTLQLQKQIVFYGKIFSQNTVGGAVLGKDESSYILPTLMNPNTTKDLDEAVKYDMSFLRMNNKNSDWAKKVDKDDKSIEKNKWHFEPVVILDNLELIKNPLPIFNFKE